MLRKALVASIVGSGVHLAISVALQFGPMLAARPYSWSFASRLLYPLTVTVIPAGSLILFFLTLLWEVSEKRGPETRQCAAVAAVFGQALQLWHLVSYARTFVPYDPAQYWSRFIVAKVLPAFLWMFLLLIYCKEVVPEAKRMTRPLAGVLCILTAASGFYDSYVMLERLGGLAPTGWDLWWTIARRVAYLASWVSVTFLLFAICRRCQGRIAQAGT